MQEDQSVSLVHLKDFSVATLVWFVVLTNNNLLHIVFSNFPI